MKRILFILISQLLLVNSVSAYTISNSYGVTSGQYGYSYSTYGYSYPYVNTYYGSSNNTVSNSPRTVTMDCRDNNPPSAPGTISYMVYRMPTCSSLTGEGSLTYSYSSQGTPIFSGVSNYRCISYYYNGSCSEYLYDTTYTPPVSRTQTATYDYGQYQNSYGNTNQYTYSQYPTAYSLPTTYNQYPTTYSWPTYGVSQYTYTQ